VKLWKKLVIAILLALALLAIGGYLILLKVVPRLIGWLSAGLL
jgi:hypothetical protein